MLTLRSLTKRYGPLVAVDHLDLEVREGEVFGLLGPNGAGKSTTVGMAVGLIAPDEGEARIGAFGPPGDPAVRRRIGVAPQALSLYDELSAQENLAFFGEVYGLRGAALRARIEWALDFVGLRDRRKDRVSTYSGGMKRRINLAVALVHDPPVVLLDEPTVGVDPQSRHAILERILAMRATGRTVLYTTHYMEEASRLCDRVGIIDRGRLLALDTVDGLIRAHGGMPTLVVRSGGEEIAVTTSNPVAELSKIASSRAVDDFHVARADLEQVFLNLTGRTLRD
jgi:ABC-2 type transport system ATP-binding protein